MVISELKREPVLHAREFCVGQRRVDLDTIPQPENVGKIRPFFRTLRKPVNFS